MSFPDSLKSYAAQLGFPSSANLARIFELLYQDEDEVKLVTALPGTVPELAAKTGLSEAKARELVGRLLHRGAIGPRLHRPDLYRRFPAMIELRDASILWPEAPRELSECWERLINQELLELVPALKNLKVEPMVRVVPIERSVQAQNTVLDVDSARKIFADAELISVLPCACRTMARQNGRGQGCPAPASSVCMQTNAFAQAVLNRGIGERIDNREALKRVGEAEDAGLVHMIRNNVKQDMFMCNCCSCCCTGLYFVNRLGYAEGVAKSRFKVELDSEACTGCGACEDRCQFHAISMEETAVIAEESCYGCGNCAVACPEEALTLVEVRPVESIRVK